METKKVTIEDLKDYIANRKAGLSLNDYIGVVADLKDIIFNEAIDLSNTNLSGSILDGVNFNRFVKLENANLQGTSLVNTTFTEQIDLAGVNFGRISPSRKMFVACQINDAIFTPVKIAVKEIRISNKLIDEYLASNEKSLSEYLQKKYKQVVIADLSSIEIDSRFSGKDLSNCKFVGSIFKGRIQNLILRDCFFEQIKPSEDCVLISPDLRGTSLAERIDTTLYSPASELYSAEYNSIWGFNSINPHHHMILEDPCLSVGSDEHFQNYLIRGNAKLDPCYKPEKEIQKLRHIHQVQLEDILKESTIEGIDFAGLDLRNVKLAGKTFRNCNFADTKLSGMNAKGSVFENCSFYGADFSSKLGGWWYKAALLADAEFKICDLTYADLTGVDARQARFTQLTAVNINAAGFNFFGRIINNLKLDGAQADQGNFAGANMPELSAKALQAEGANFAHANCGSADFTDAKLQYANFYNTNLQRAQLVRSNISHARFTKAQVAESRWIDTAMDDCCLAGVFGLPEVYDNIKGEPIDCKEVNQFEIAGAKNRKARNLSRIYDNLMMGIAGVTVVVAIAAPLTLSGTAAFAAGLILDKIAFAAIVAFAADKVAKELLPEQFRIGKIIAEFPLIKPIIARSCESVNKRENEVIKLHEQKIEESKQIHRGTSIKVLRKTYVEKLQEQNNNRKHKEITS